MKTVLASILAGALALTAMATVADAAIVGVHVGPVGVAVGHRHHHHWHHHRHWGHHHHH